jgi:hypothetical protein
MFGSVGVSKQAMEFAQRNHPEFRVDNSYWGLPPT